MPAKPFPTRQLGRNGPTVSALGFGAMGIGAFYGPSNDEECIKTLTYAADRGITFWDTADVYGTSETFLGKWFTETGRRDEIFLATKFGAGRSPNSKPDYIRGQLAKSLANLKTDHIDLYYQHRVDPDVPIEIVLQTLQPFVEKGQVRWIGLSECSAETLRRARAVPGVGEKVVAAQMEFSPFELGIEKTGFAAAAEEAGVAVVVYSPLSRGLVTGEYRSPADFAENDYRRMMPRFSPENFPKNLRVTDKLRDIAAKYNATPSQITLAWILAEHKNFVPIPGTRSIKRLEENAHGAEITLSAEDVSAIRAVAENADVAGARYSALPQGDCIPLSQWKL
ncbi:NADP-dependent oxidoreductase domain-containing protein [Infundibulicybe gibba]|nr:NADP-dependent oxidoreductase domain-containing protein [Infundibulicybe gibba]